VDHANWSSTRDDRGRTTERERTRTVDGGDASDLAGGHERLLGPSHRRLPLIPEYRSGIFTHSDEQEQVAKAVTAEVQDK